MAITATFTLVLSFNPLSYAWHEFLGIDSRASAKKRKRLRDKEKEFDDIKDDDLKRELSKGSTLINYFEHQPQ